jgi:mono/diheme cytochrome c family protein
MFRKPLMGFALLLAGVALAGETSPAQAQERGNAERGQALALRICVACHGVRKGETSVNPLAPPFDMIAESKGVSAIALNVALLSPHRAMPNIMLDANERGDLVAYILSLKAN